MYLVKKMESKYRFTFVCNIQFRKKLDYSHHYKQVNKLLAS